MKRLWRMLCAMTVLAVAAVPLAKAQEPASTTDSNGWRFSMAPYLWAISLDGNLSARGRSADVSADFIDIVKESDSILGYFSQFELGKGRWSAFIAPAYMDVTFEENANVGPLSLNADVDSTTLIFEFGGAYRLSEWGRDAKGAGGTLDLIAGGRYTRLQNEIKLQVGGLPPGFAGAIKVKSTKDWVDPFVGARLGLRLSDHWRFQLRGDVGGFDLGSDLTLQGVSVIGYDLSIFGRDSSIFAGYRALYQDYDEGSGASKFAWDMTFHGPILGVQFRW